MSDSELLLYLVGMVVVYVAGIASGALLLAWIDSKTSRRSQHEANERVARNKVSGFLKGNDQW
jgi:hypothetical protein